MTLDEAMKDQDLIGVSQARAELKKHGCRVVNSEMRLGEQTRILVTNDHDPEEWIDCTPKTILEWLGY